jgi:hypothetical protein
VKLSKRFDELIAKQEEMAEQLLKITKKQQ